MISPATSARADISTNTFTHGFALDALQVEPLMGVVSGPGGREKLDPKVMDVLMDMADHAGQVVLREDLLARLWPNVVVTDDALTRCFYELRRCLARAGGNDCYRSLLDTVPKRGYRLNAAIRPLGPAMANAAVPDLQHAPPREPRGIWMRGIALGATFVAFAALLSLSRSPVEEAATANKFVIESIVVLPVIDMRDEGSGLVARLPEGSPESFLA